MEAIRFLRFLIYPMVVGVVYWLFSDLACLRFNTADASTYLNIAENIATHKGFVISYDLYQCFHALYYPIWPFMQSLYPLLCSLVFMLHGGVEQIIKINILIFGLNTALVLYIVQRSMPTAFNLLFSLFLVCSLNFYVSALYAWTEQFHFLCFIVTFILFLRFQDRLGALFWLGILNGICMFVRAAHVYNFLAYLPVIFIGKDPLPQKFNRAFCFVGGFILVYGAYQLFCLLSYHTFFPQYAHPAMSYGMSYTSSGIFYDLNKFGIQAPSGPVFSLQHLLYIGQHLRDFYKQMPNFLWPALFYYFLPVKKRVEGGLIELCLFQSIFTCLGYSLTFYWLTFSFDALRYSMIPFVLISVVGWYSLYQGLSFSGSIPKMLVGLLVLVCVFLLPQVQRTVHFRKIALTQPFMQNHIYKDMYAAFYWIDKNLPKEVLVASSEDQNAYFMHRPFISMPHGRSYNCTNLALYNRIYSPDYYLLSSLLSDKCFESIPHTKIYSHGIFRVFAVQKNKI